MRVPAVLRVSSPFFRPQPPLLTLCAIPPPCPASLSIIASTLPFLLTPIRPFCSRSIITRVRLFTVNHRPFPTLCLCPVQVRPVADEGQLADLPTLPFSSLRPEFRRDVESLRKRILTTVRVKTVFGKEGG